MTRSRKDTLTPEHGDTCLNFDNKKMSYNSDSTTAPITNPDCKPSKAHIHIAHVSKKTKEMVRNIGVEIRW